MSFGDFRYAVAPDQGLGQALLMVHIVEAETSLDAETPMIRRAVASFDVVDLIVLDIEGEQTADAAVGTGGGHLLVGTHEAGILGRHERARRAGLHAFPAGDAGAHAHRIIEVEDDLRVQAAESIADHIIDLFFAASPYAARALDTSVEIHRDGGVRQIGVGLLPAGETGPPEPQPFHPVIELGARRIGRSALARHVREQQLQDQFLRMPRPLARARDLHAVRGSSATGGC